MPVGVEPWRLSYLLQMGKQLTLQKVIKARRQVPTPLIPIEFQECNRGAMLRYI